jgi:ureidoacrylate peracid hydrolase
MPHDFQIITGIAFFATEESKDSRRQVRGRPSQLSEMEKQITNFEQHNMETQVERSTPWDRWHADESRTSLVRPTRSAIPISFEANPDSVEVDLATSALLIIDMQNDFLDSKGWFATNRGQDPEPLKSVIDPINSLASAFREIKTPVIHINWGVRADTANLPANVIDKASGCGVHAAYGDSTQMGRVLVQDDWGSQSIDEITVAETDIHVSKHRLSGFCDNELDQILRRLGVTTLFFTGVNIDRCVFATLMDGTFQGYDAVLVEDACQTPSPAYVSDAILYLVRLLYGFTAKTAPILNAITNQILSTPTSKGKLHD